MFERDVAVVGAGAAGLMAAIWAARTRPGTRVIALDGAVKLGAKILVAGGGRCNVTHDFVSEDAYAGSSKNAIKKVLKRFDVHETVKFFGQMGVELKREATGKLFPVTDSARTVLEALLRTASDHGVEIAHPRRIESVESSDGGFSLKGTWGKITAKRVILATGGKSLPKSGSDGAGYQIAVALGHTVTPLITPALVPLLLPDGHLLTTLSGISADVRLKLLSGADQTLQTVDGALLCTHFGVSGPAVLDISRYWVRAVHDDPNTSLTVNWLPGENFASVDAQFAQSPKISPLRWLDGRLVDRLSRALCGSAGIDPVTPLGRLTRQERQALSRTLVSFRLPITGTRGFTFAEVTAGGVPLTEIDLKTMESRVCPGLYLCGEICDVDGRIGGYNFQWAWSSGYVAGISAAAD